MSFDLVRTVRAKKLPSSTLKNVLVYLAERASHDGRNIWPAIDTIAAETGFSTSTVDVAISKLKKIGLIVKVGHVVKMLVIAGMLLLGKNLFLGVKQLELLEIPKQVNLQDMS